MWSTSKVNRKDSVHNPRHKGDAEAKADKTKYVELDLVDFSHGFYQLLASIPLLHCDVHIREPFFRRKKALSRKTARLSAWGSERAEGEFAGVGTLTGRKGKAPTSERRQGPQQNKR